MTKKTILKWRLGKLPTSSEVIELVSNKVITQEEAREILFSSSEEDTEGLKSEIKFLRELINKLSDRNTIVEKIRYIENPYKQWGWYQPYGVWCGAAQSISGSIALCSGNTATTVTSGTNSLNSSALSQSQSNMGIGVSTNYQPQTSFADIKTF